MILSKQLFNMVVDGWGHRENKNDQKSGTLQVQTFAQSRTNKWRAKHEAMLNSANNNKKKAEF